MIWAIRQLGVPLNYLRIRHGEGVFHSKIFYDFVLPAVLAGTTCGIFAWLGLPLVIFSQAQMVDRLSDLLALMIVFYMAALAAVATFDRDGIDDKLAGGDATLSVRDPKNGGKRVRKALSYRQFISYLFGFLSFSSLCLYVFLIIFSVGWPRLEAHFSGNHQVYEVLTSFVDPLIFLLMMFAVWQLIVTSLLGIYFLTERIQTLNDKAP